MTDQQREPILRVVPGPTDINANGHIFGGWVLSQMDIAAGIVAARRARGPVATIAPPSITGSAPIRRSWSTAIASRRRVPTGTVAMSPPLLPRIAAMVMSDSLRQSRA